MDNFSLNSKPAGISHRLGDTNTMIGNDAGGQRVTDTMRLVAQFSEVDSRLREIRHRLAAALSRWNGQSGNPNIAIGTEIYSSTSGETTPQAIGATPGRVDELNSIAERQTVSLNMIETMLSGLEEIV